MLLGKILYREHLQVFLKKVDVPNTDPLGLIKRVPIPLTKMGPKKDFPV